MQYVAVYRETGAVAGPFESEHDAIAHAIAIDLIWGEEPEAWEGWDDGWDDAGLGNMLGRSAVLSDIGEAGWLISEMQSPADSLAGAREAASPDPTFLAELPDGELDSDFEARFETASDGGEI